MVVIEQQAFTRRTWGEDTQVRIHVEGRGDVLRHQEGLRRIRQGKEVRQHGEGDGPERVHLQRVHGSGDDLSRSERLGRGHPSQ